MSHHGWIGVDFDGTLATHEPGQFPEVGEPLMPMVERVRAWLAEGRDVRIMTARADYEQHRYPVVLFCRRWFGRNLPITDRKDFQMLELWDDRAIQVDSQTGEPLMKQFIEWKRSQA